MLDAIQMVGDFSVSGLSGLIRGTTVWKMDKSKVKSNIARPQGLMEG